MHYGWFNDKLKSIENDAVSFSFRQIGYDEDQIGALVIENEEGKLIRTASKIPIEQLKVLISDLEPKF